MPDYDIDKLKLIPIREIIQRATGKDFVRRGNIEFTNCPFHYDPGPSLSINEDTNEWYCHGSSCGKGGDGVRFVELHLTCNFQDACKWLVDNFDSSAVKDGDGKKKKASKGAGTGRKSLPRMPIPDGALINGFEKALKTEWWLKNYGELVAAWRYHDANGGVAYCDVRFEKEIDGEKKKQVLPMYFSVRATWKMGIPFTIIDKPYILYNLHMLAAKPTAPALVVEGCKCASVDAPGLKDRFILTTWPAGTNGIAKVDVRPLFRRKVVIWPDNDPVSKQWTRGGYKAAYYLAERLGDKSEITILRAAEHPKGGETIDGYDIADYIEDGGDPVAYIADANNHISIEDAKELAGLIEPETDKAPDFRDVRKFTTLNNVDADKILDIRSVLATNKEGNITKSDGNFLTIVGTDPAFRFLVAYDTATNDIKYSDIYTELDELDNKIWQYTQMHYEIAPTKTQRTDMVKTIAYKNAFNSLEVFLDEMQAEIFGDNEPVFEANPLDELLNHITFALEDDYNDMAEVRKYYTELFHKYFLRMFVKLEYIVRGDIDMIPPADIVPILEGNQGIGKTRLCLLLSIEPRKYYVDMAELQLTTSRDTVAKIRGKIIGELGELAGLKRTELETIKSFISATFDEMRRLYSESTVRSPRTISFIGTTNEREYLRDTTGNRRFWPVRIAALNDEIYGKRELIKRLYVYYRQEARKTIAGDTVSDDLVISKGLYEFTQYLREEKRVKPVFLDFIMSYIEKAEVDAMIDDPVKVSVNLAAVKMMNLPDEDMLQKMPARFQTEMCRILEMRGYKPSRGIFQGKQRRYWILKGRYCVKCSSVVGHVTGYEVDGVVQRVCDACLDNVKVADPF